MRIRVRILSELEELAAHLSGESTGVESNCPMHLPRELLSLNGNNILEAKYAVHLILCRYFYIISVLRGRVFTSYGF